VSSQKRLSREKRSLKHVRRLHYQHVFQPTQVLKFQSLIWLERKKDEGISERLKMTSVKQRGCKRGDGKITNKAFLFKLLYFLQQQNKAIMSLSIHF